jgi:hypothetical protein
MLRKGHEAGETEISIFQLWRKPAFKDMVAPFAPSLPPLGAGVHVMPRYYLVQKHLSHFL